MTGPYAAFGVKFYQAYNLAADEINAAGGIKGRPIQIVFEDSQDKLDLAQTAARKLVENPKIVALMGGRLSGAGMAIAQIAEREHIAYLVDHPSADIITKSGFQWTCRLNPASSRPGFATRRWPHRVRRCAVRPPVAVSDLLARHGAHFPKPETVSAPDHPGKRDG